MGLYIFTGLIFIRYSKFENIYYALLEEDLRCVVRSRTF